MLYQVYDISKTMDLNKTYYITINSDFTKNGQKVVLGVNEFAGTFNKTTNLDIWRENDGFYPKEFNDTYLWQGILLCEINLPYDNPNFKHVIAKNRYRTKLRTNYITINKVYETNKFHELCISNNISIDQLNEEHLTLFVKCVINNKYDITETNKSIVKYYERQWRYSCFCDYIVKKQEKYSNDPMFLYMETINESFNVEQLLKLVDEIMVKPYDSWSAGKIMQAAIRKYQFNITELIEHYLKYPNVLKYIDIGKIIKSNLALLYKYPIETIPKMILLHKKSAYGYIFDDIYGYDYHTKLFDLFFKSEHYSYNMTETMNFVKEYGFTYIIPKFNPITLTSDHNYNNMNIFLVTNYNYKQYDVYYIIYDDVNLYKCSIDNKMFTQIKHNERISFMDFIGFVNEINIVPEFIEEYYNPQDGSINPEQNNKYYMCNTKSGYIKFCETDNCPTNCLKNIIDYDGNYNENYKLYSFDEKTKTLYILPKTKTINYIIKHFTNNNEMNNIRCYKNLLVKILEKHNDSNDLSPLSKTYDNNILQPLICHYICELLKYNNINNIAKLLAYHFNVNTIGQIIDTTKYNYYNGSINLSILCKHYGGFDEFLKLYDFNEICANNNITLNMTDVILYNKSLIEHNHKFKIEPQNLANIDEYDEVNIDGIEDVKILCLSPKDFIYNLILIKHFGVAKHLLQLEYVGGGINIGWKKFTNAIIRSCNLDLLQTWVNICNTLKIPVVSNPKSIENALVNENINFLDNLKTMDVFLYDKTIMSTLMTNKKYNSIKWWIDNGLNYDISRSAKNCMENDQHITDLIMIK